MNPIEINHKAMEALSEGEFLAAQKLFYENAKRFPSHETISDIIYIRKVWSVRTGKREAAINLVCITC